MLKQPTKKSHSFQSSIMKKTQVFRAKLPFHNIILFSDGNQLSLLNKLHHKVKEVRKMKVKVSPDQTHLIDIQHENQIYSVSEENIQSIDDFCYRLGILSDKSEDRHETLRKAEWSVCDDGLICKVQHTTEKDIRYYALGWFETLPENVIHKAKKNKWMINLSSFREAKEMLKENKENISFYSEIYSGDGILPVCLSSIPVSLYSVTSDKVKEEEKEHVDILKLRNLENYFEFTRLKWGTDRMIKTPLDLFDAMVSLHLPWKVDRKSELIYLPCIPSAPKRSPSVYTTQLPERSNDNRNVLDFYNNSHSSIKKELLHTMFPYMSQSTLSSISRKLVEKEFARRLGLCSKKLLAYGFGQLNNYLDNVFCILPPAFA